MFYLYTILCPDTSKVVYVGKAKNYKGRCSSHITAYDSPPISIWIRSLKDQGKLPIFNLLDKCENEWIASQMEIHYIKHYSKINPLYNVKFNENRIHKKS